MGSKWIKCNQLSRVAANGGNETFRYFISTNEGTTDLYEFEDDWCKRQIMIHSDVVMLLKGGEQTDSPLSEFPEHVLQPVSGEGFLSLWNEYSERPHGTVREDHPLVGELLQHIPRPSVADITSWQGDLFRWDPRLDSVFAHLDTLCGGAARPSPEAAPVQPARLSLRAVYEKPVATLKEHDLRTLVRWIRPWLQDDVDALRFYLPHLLRFYWAGLIGPELETALLLYREQLSAGEIALVTEVAVHRARATYWAWDAVFPLFWCDDPETLAEAFQKTDELWVALRSYVRRSSDPLWYLWDGRYNLPPGVDLYGSLVERKGQRILLFLRKVGWIE